MASRRDNGFDYDWIVVGSGFGGSVSALRMAEKGYRVAVLECGRRFRLRDLLKFDFFFPDRERSREDLGAEMELIQPGWESRQPEDLAELVQGMLRSGALMARRAAHAQMLHELHDRLSRIDALGREEVGHAVLAT